MCEPGWRTLDTGLGSIQSSVGLFGGRVGFVLIARSVALVVVLRCDAQRCVAFPYCSCGYGIVLCVLCGVGTRFGSVRLVGCLGVH